MTANPPDPITDWYARQPWLCGFNYLPRTAINWIELWQADSFDAATIDERRKGQRRDGRGRDGSREPPPHRSGHAALPHPAPASGDDAQALLGMWMDNPRLR
jgi:hypothetical protein